MNKSEDIKELVINLVKAKNEFKTPKRSKKAYNYYYAPMDEVLDATEPALFDNGLTVSQFVLSEGEKIGIETMIMHESGQYITSKFFANANTVDPQKLGSAVTYFRRYAYMAALNIAPEDDDGESVSGKASSKNPNETGGGGREFTCGSPKQQQFLLKLIKEDSGNEPTAATKEYVAKLSPDEIKKKISEYLDKKK